MTKAVLSGRFLPKGQVRKQVGVFFALGFAISILLQGEQNRKSIISSGLLVPAVVVQDNTPSLLSDNNTLLTSDEEKQDEFHTVLLNFDSYAPHEINKLRRNLFHKSPEELKMKFMDYAQRRQAQPIYYHHIPKSAGSYMCGLARTNFQNRAVQTINCHLRELGPRWAGVTPKFMTCSALESKVNNRLHFFANERFLDYSNESFFCDSFRYVMAVRDPISRVKSHFNHMKKALSQNPLCLNNYMTWALLSSKMEPNSSYPKQTGGKWPVNPELTWLEEAEELLWGYDYVLSSEEDECRDLVLKLIGFNVTRQPARENVANVTTYYEYDENEIIQHNQMDIRLFQVSKLIMQADCDFAREFFARKNSKDNR